MTQEWFGLGLDISGFTNSSSMMVLSQATANELRPKKFVIKSVILDSLPNEKACLRILKDRGMDEDKITEDQLAEVQLKHIYHQLQLAKYYFPTLDEKKVRFVIDTVIDEQDLLALWGLNPDQVRKSHYKEQKGKQRAIDVYYGNNLRPFGSWIGPVLHRFKLMKLVAEEQNQWALDRNLFESYPRACFIELNKDQDGIENGLFDSEKYKSEVKDHIKLKVRFTGTPPYWEDIRTQNNGIPSPLAKNYRGMNIHIDDSVQSIISEWVDDYLDAMICSIVGSCPDSLNDSHLLYKTEQYSSRVGNNREFKPFNSELPAGYRLVKCPYWDRIDVVGTTQISYLFQHPDADHLKKLWKRDSNAFCTTKITDPKKGRWDCPVCPDHKNREISTRLFLQDYIKRNGCDLCKKKKKAEEKKLMRNSRV